MISRAAKVKLFSFLILISFLTICCRQAETSTRTKLKAYLDTIKVVDTHEHQRPPTDYKTTAHNFYFLLAHTYLKSDLVSAGAQPLRDEIVDSHDLNTLWDLYGPYLNFSRGTSYYGHFVRGFQTLYGLADLYFTKENIQSLSEKIAEHYRDFDSWYAEAFQKAGFETMFVDANWNPFNTKIDKKYFSLVFNINDLVYAISEKDSPDGHELYRLAGEQGFAMRTLDDYLAFAFFLFQGFLDNGVVCLKNSMAYGRTLDYEYVPDEKAKSLFLKDSTTLSKTEKKELQDFMFHWIIRKSIEVNLPIQIHTGYLAGNGNTLENSRPTRLNPLFLSYPEARFILFHGGYPWTGEFSALGKMFPNVYLDLVWLPQISREAAVRALDEMLDNVPYNKFFWGGDCQSIEESTGSLEFGKSVVAQVLAARIERGLLTEDVAFEIAESIFRGNAISVFKLDLH